MRLVGFQIQKRVKKEVDIMKLGDSSRVSISSNTKGSSISEVIFLSVAVLVLLGSVSVVFAVSDPDGDGYTANFTNGTKPADCDESSAEVRPVNNGSPTFIGYNIRICPGNYSNVTLIVNGSSNSSLWIVGGTANGSANFTFDGTNASLRNWILINQTLGGVGIANLSVYGFKLNDSANSSEIITYPASETLGINISNSSNINISAVKMVDLAHETTGIFIKGDNIDNITIGNNAFYNLSHGSVIYVNASGGATVNISQNNFSSEFNTTNDATINITGGLADVIITNNSFTTRAASVATGAIWLTGNNNKLYNNTFHNFSYGIYLNNSDNNTLIDNVQTLNYADTSGAGLYLQRSDTNTIKYNHLQNATGYGMVLETSTRNSISNNTFHNNTDGNVLLNSSSDHNEIKSNNVTFSLGAAAFGMLINDSDNNTLGFNSYRNNSIDGLLIHFSFNITAVRERFWNSSGQGLQIWTSNDTVFENTTMHNNVSQVNFNLTSVDNITLDRFNSSFSGGDGLLIWKSSRINITDFLIFNSTDDGIEIRNSTNITTGRPKNVSMFSNINDSINYGILVWENSSWVNISTLHISNSSDNGIHANGSFNVGFHNLTVANTSLDGVEYYNMSGPKSVLGFCNLNNAATGTNLNISNSTASTFQCDPINGTYLSSVHLKVSNRAGSSVAFDVGVNLTDVTLEKAINFSQTSVVINSSALFEERNVTGNITFSDLPWEADGVIASYGNNSDTRSCGSNCTVTQTGTTLSFNVSHFSSFAAKQVVVQSFSVGGGGGGGGRGAGFRFIVPTAQGVSVVMNTYDAGRLRIGTGGAQGVYDFKVTRTYRDQADIAVAHKGYKLSLGRSVNLDLDGDSKSDVNVALVRVLHNQVELVVTLGAKASAAPAPTAAVVSEPVAEPVAAEPEAYEAPADAPTDEPVAAEAPPAPSPKKKGSGGMVFTLIVVVVVIGLLYMHFRKKKEMV